MSSSERDTFAETLIEVLRSRQSPIECSRVRRERQLHSKTRDSLNKYTRKIIRAFSDVKANETTFGYRPDLVIVDPSHFEQPGNDDRKNSCSRSTKSKSRNANAMPRVKITGYNAREGDFIVSVFKQEAERGNDDTRHKTPKTVPIPIAEATASSFLYICGKSGPNVLFAITKRIQSNKKAIKADLRSPTETIRLRTLNKVIEFVWVSVYNLLKAQKSMYIGLELLPFSTRPRGNKSSVGRKEAMEIAALRRDETLLKNTDIESESFSTLMRRIGLQVANWVTVLVNKNITQNLKNKVSEPIVYYVQVPADQALKIARETVEDSFRDNDRVQFSRKPNRTRKLANDTVLIVFMHHIAELIQSYENENFYYNYVDQVSKDISRLRFNVIDFGPKMDMTFRHFELVQKDSPDAFLKRQIDIYQRQKNIRLGVLQTMPSRLTNKQTSVFDGVSYSSCTGLRTTIDKSAGLLLLCIEAIGAKVNIGSKNGMQEYFLRAMDGDFFYLNQTQRVGSSSNLVLSGSRGKLSSKKKQSIVSASTTPGSIYEALVEMETNKEIKHIKLVKDVYLPDNWNVEGLQELKSKNAVPNFDRGIETRSARRQMRPRRKV